MKKFFQKYYIIIMASITLVGLITGLYYEHQEKAKYRNYISQQLKQNFNIIREDIVASETLYDTILNINKFNQNYGYDGTKTEAFALTYRSESIQSAISNLETISYEMGYIEEYAPSSLKQSLTAISAYFDSKIDPSKSISNEHREIINIFRAYNSQLIQTLFNKTELFDELGRYKDKYTEDQYALQVSDPVWLETIELLEETSVRFLKEHNLNKLSDVIH